MTEATPESFEKAIAELEALVQKMDRADVGLESMLTDYKRGAYLVKFCRDKLATVRQEVADVDSMLADSEDD